MKEETFEVTIPFAGFYCSAHEQQLDYTLEQMLSDREGRGVSASDKLREIAFDAIEWDKVHEAYAKAYAENLLNEFDLAGEFTALDSPQFYNYETDRIFVKISRAALAKMWRGCDKTILTRIANERHTSCPGFISHYAPEWRSWGRLSEWDHNQLGTLIRAYIETEQGDRFKDWDELGLMEWEQGNYGFEIMFLENSKPEFERVLNIWDYLQDRAERKAA